MADDIESVIFHVDLDAFYASVEQLDNPQYRGKPVIVGARPGRRGVVAACSYEARRYGIHSAMPASQAHRRCPHAFFVPVRMSRYREVSRRVMEVFTEFTPSLQQISVDEAFLDLSGTRRLFGTPRQTALRLKEQVRAQTGLAVTVGVAATRFVAKLASAFDKPDGLHVVEPGQEADFVLGLDLKDLWGVGRKTLLRLKALQIDSVAALRGAELPFLRGHFGESTGDYLYRASRGIDPGIYSSQTRSHSISSETTFEIDVNQRPLIERTLLELAEHVMFRLREERCSGATVTVKVRDSEFATHSAQHSLKHDLSSLDELYGEALGLLNKRWNGRDALRLIGLGVSGIEHNRGGGAQASLFSDETEQKRRKVEQALLDLRHRHPNAPAVTRARLLPDSDSSTHDATEDQADPRSEP